MKQKFKDIIENIKFFVPIIWKVSPWTVILTIISGILSTTSSMLFVLFPQYIIAELINEKRTEVLILLVIAFSASKVIVNILSNAISSILFFYTRKADFYIEELIQNKVMQIDYYNLEDPDFIDQLTRAKAALNEYTNGIYSIMYMLRQIVTSIFTITGIISIILVSKQYFAILIVIASIVINAIFTIKIQKSDKRFNDLIVRSWRKLNYFNKNITNLRMQKELRAFNAKPVIEGICDKMNGEVFSQYKEQADYRMRIHIIGDFLTNGIFKILIIAAILYSRYPKYIAIDEFTMLLSAITTLENGVNSLVYNVRQYVQDCAYQKDFILLMNKETSFSEGKQSIKHIESIEFKNVSFKYPRTEKYVLEDVSFKIDHKQKVSLVGLNGSGKTTLIKLLCRFYKLEEGEILVNGININEYAYDEYLSLMSIVFQDYKIISFSIKDNIAIIDNDQKRLADALKRSQVYDRVMELPEKENTFINKWFDKGGVEFSGGEMQKFALARAIYKNSDLVILDEPTSNLDPIAESEIYYHFNDVIGKKLTLFISHRLSSCVFSDKIIVLDNAKISEIGTHQELLKNKDGLYAKMFSSQAQYYK